ncbi:MAG: hypothetical protein ACKPEO_26865 [Sphaerospermopsis kisseleviana]|uniref:Uncharacterized protein n=1 Tax=Sphaerospermopsis kisseleviana CS-549 TaxID=3021783 RepID=A0ABT4ZTS8_9CYAN|nr:hypothetical protein [Sphaerospermopsis kisseleviana]MDB9442835.1 hypothetical protein [Sphaerospermopsis kisseleviana CS-549]BAZ79714.1 hypothetical protein NIES73_09590 [Sphaerospermopsis kisseleviana NIES-73]
MQTQLPTFWLIEPEKPPLKQIIAGGVILPDGQIAIARCCTFTNWYLCFLTCC